MTDSYDDRVAYPEHLPADITSATGNAGVVRGRLGRGALPAAALSVALTLAVLLVLVAATLAVTR